MSEYDELHDDVLCIMMAILINHILSLAYLSASRNEPRVGPNCMNDTMNHPEI